MSKKILIGLDVGTSGAKCIAADETGAVLASSTQEYPLYTPQPGWAEQNPEEWWAAVCKAIKETLEETSPEIAADVIDHGIVLTGGGALLKNLPEVISDATKVPVFIAQDPLDCVAIGTGESLKNIEVMRKRR